MLDDSTNFNTDKDYIGSEPLLLDIQCDLNELVGSSGIKPITFTFDACKEVVINMNESNYIDSDFTASSNIIVVGYNSLTIGNCTFNNVTIDGNVSLENCIINNNLSVYNNTHLSNCSVANDITVANSIDCEFENIVCYGNLEVTNSASLSYYTGEIDGTITVQNNSYLELEEIESTEECLDTKITVSSGSSLKTISCNMSGLNNKGIYISTGSSIIDENSSFSGTGIMIDVFASSDININCTNTIFNNFEYCVGYELDTNNSIVNKIKLNNCTGTNVKNVVACKDNSYEGIPFFTTCEIIGGTYTANENNEGYGIFGGSASGERIGSTPYQILVDGATFSGFKHSIFAKYIAVHVNNSNLLDTYKGIYNWSQLRVDNSTIKGRENNLSDPYSYGICNYGSSDSYNFTTPLENMNFGLINNTTIDNFSYGINRGSSNIYLYDSTIKNVYNGVTDSNKGAELNSGSGQTLIKNSKLTAAEGVKVTSDSVGVNGIIYGYDCDIIGFNIGATNSFDGDTSVNITSSKFSGGSCSLVNCNIEAIYCGVAYYCGSLYNCNIKSENFGVLVSSAAHGIFSCTITGVGDNPVAGIGAIEDSAATLTIASIDDVNANITTNSYKEYIKVVLDNPKLSSRELYTGKTQISNFEFGATGAQINIMSSHIYDCDYGIYNASDIENAPQTYTKFPNKKIVSRSPSLYVKDGVVIEDCNIGIWSNNAYKYLSNPEIQGQTKIQNCKIGWKINGYTNFHTPVNENHRLMDINNCELGMDIDYTMNIIHSSYITIHDCDTAIKVRNVGPYLTGLKLYNNKIGIEHTDLVDESKATFFCNGSDFMYDEFLNNDVALKLANPILFRSSNAANIDDTVMEFTENGRILFDTVDKTKPLKFTYKTDNYIEDKIICYTICNQNNSEGNPLNYTEYDSYNVYTDNTLNCNIYVPKNGYIAWFKNLDNNLKETNNEINKNAVVLIEGIYVTYDYTTNGGDSLSSTQEMFPVPKGEEIDLSLTATKDGYEFVGWSTSPNSHDVLTTSDDITSITDITGDITLYAVYKKSVDITYNKYDGRTFTQSVDFYNNEDNLTIATMNYDNTNDDAHYTFKGYTLSTEENMFNEGEDVIVELSTPLNIDCVYEKVSTLTYKDHQGNLIEKVFDTVISKDILNELFEFALKTYTAPFGYVFNGWRLSDGTILNIDELFNTLLFDIEVTADLSEIKAKSIVVTPKNSEVKVGETVQLTATISPEDTLDKSVTWTSSDNTVATVDNNGLVTTLKEGEVTITATTNDGSNLSDSANIKVYEEYKITYDYTTNGGDSIDKEFEIFKNGTNVNLNNVKATKLGYKFIGWSLDKDDITCENEITINGSNITVYAIYKKDFTITYHTYDDSLNYTDTITIYNNENSKETELLDYPLDNTYNFIGYSNSIDSIEVIEDDTIMVDNDIDIYCVYKISSNLKYYTKYNEKIEECYIDTQDIFATGKNITSKYFIYQLKELPKYDNFKVIGWLEEDKLDSYTENDLLTDRYSTILEENSLYCILEKIEEEVESLRVTPKEATINTQETIQLTATLESTKPHTITWSSSDEKIATVDENGLVTAHSIGKVTITASTNDESNLSDSAIINVIEVNEPPIPEIRKVNINGTLKFSNGEFANKYYVSLACENEVDGNKTASIIETVTNEKGYYSFENQIPNTYTLKIMDNNRNVLSTSIINVSNDNKFDKIDISNTVDTVTINTNIDKDTFTIDATIKVDEPTEPEKPNAPKTGDNSHPIIWLGVMLISLTGITILYKKKEEDN